MQDELTAGLVKKIDESLKQVEHLLPKKKEDCQPYMIEHINANGIGTYHIIKLKYDDSQFIVPPNPQNFKDAFEEYYYCVQGINFFRNGKLKDSRPVRIRLGDGEDKSAPRVTATLDPHYKTMYFSYNKKDLESQLIIRGFTTKLLNGGTSQNQKETSSGTKPINAIMA